MFVVRLESKLKYEKISSEGLKKRFNLIELEVFVVHSYTSDYISLELLTNRSKIPEQIRIISLTSFSFCAAKQKNYGRLCTWIAPNASS